MPDQQPVPSQRESRSDELEGLLLTAEERQDLDQILLHYRGATAWVERDAQQNEPEIALRRRRALCDRMIEANRA